MSNSFGYKVYAGVLTTDLQLDTFTDLGGNVQGGFIINDDSTNPMSVQFAYNTDGASASFGDALVLKSGERLVVDGLGYIRAIKLIWTANVAYRILVSANRSTIQ